MLTSLQKESGKCLLGWGISWRCFIVLAPYFLWISCLYLVCFSQILTWQRTESFKNIADYATSVLKALQKLYDCCSIGAKGITVTSMGPMVTTLSLTCMLQPAGLLRVTLPLLYNVSGKLLSNPYCLQTRYHHFFNEVSHDHPIEKCNCPSTQYFQSPYPALFLSDHLPPLISFLNQHYNYCLLSFSLTPNILWVGCHIAPDGSWWWGKTLHIFHSKCSYREIYFCLSCSVTLPECLRTVIAMWQVLNSYLVKEWMNELENYVTEWNQWIQWKDPEILFIFQSRFKSWTLHLIAWDISRFTLPL